MHPLSESRREREEKKNEEGVDLMKSKIKGSSSSAD